LFRGITHLVFGIKKKLNLALQGGGAHGAFTWGVLDRLLDDEKIQLSWISAASAGAINAVAVADGLASAGRQGAKDKLREVWEGVYRAGVPDLLRANPFFFGIAQAVAGLWSPYDLNPLGIDPLRQLLAETIDFERLRKEAPIELLVSATDVGTGRPHFFRNDQMSVDAVLASACLPTLHHATEINGRAYWDGGFSANPDLINLARQSSTRDTLLVQLAPLSIHALPTGAREITANVNRLTFNAPLLRDVELIEEVRDAARGAGSWPTRGARALLRHRFHLIEAGKYTSELSEESKMKPDWGLFSYLHGAGRTQAEIWLSRHRRDLGRRETVNLREHFLTGHERASVARIEADPSAVEAKAVNDSEKTSADPDRKTGS
jgi:NTE family protein